MKTPQPLHLALSLALLLSQPLVSPAITFTGDALIGANNTTFDGLDIVVSNCTVTVDGAHTFASLQILQGGIVTHTFAASGTLPADILTVTGEAHVLSSTNAALLNFSNVLASTVVVRDISGTLVYTNGQDYQVTLQLDGSAWIQLVAGSAIPDGATDLVDYQYSGPIVPSGLTLTVSHNVLIEPGGSINVNGTGYGGGQGPGHGSSVGSPTSGGGGGGHGGNGGYGAGLDGLGTVYDSISQPTDKGSGGGGGFNGTGGAGGGAIKLIVGGALLVDGNIKADGANAITNRSGGGAGGSIWVESQTLAGSGLISANGGSGELSQGGGGGGGRIAVQVAVNLFNGQTTAAGGNGFSYGGAGTIYTGAGKSGQVLVDNAGHPGLTTLAQFPSGLDLTAQGGAVISMPGSQSLGNLTIRSNAWLSVSNLSSQQFTVLGNVTIDAGGGITADSAGSLANQGRGPGRVYSYPVTTAGGGAYGGNGGIGGGEAALGGLAYGSFFGPTDLGSGGGSSFYLGNGSAGGGAIHFIVNGTLVDNGRISADGGTGLSDGSGGGSGGSVWLSAGTLAGAGVISANGGAGSGSGLYAGGGGGGGRIAIQSGLSLFFGMTTARGGRGFVSGGAGTIYTSGKTQSTGQLLVDNGGTIGTNTPFAVFTPVVDLTVSGGAVITLPGQQASFGNVLIASNGWIVVSNSQLVTATGNATIQRGGSILANGTGLGAGLGLGAGRAFSVTGNTSVGGGAGHGGYGGEAAGNTSAITHTGGSTYSSLVSPVEPGSGGGGTVNFSGLGGAGGGSLHLTVTGTLDLDGVIAANGNAGSGSGGGGSGGSLWLSAGTLSGGGTISVNGGNGNGGGGGGGGGRIALTYGANAFSGSVLARGGSGVNWGGAGTIYTKSNTQQAGQLVIDNGGQPGTNTTWIATSTLDLTISGGAVVTPPSSQGIGNLLIGPNSMLLISNQTLTISGNATVQAGGSILADGTGFPSGQGPGAGRFGDSQLGSTSGGGGHGGYGANGSSTVGVGGSTYDSISSPVQQGSGGGGISTYGLGGSGGGAIRLNVTGTLTVLGRISANGGSGTTAGGSGGSIWLTVGTLSGSGIISANGGIGSGQNGGGGGGRIAILYTANGFAGGITAYGGGGYGIGGAGTVYFRNNSPGSVPVAQVIVDNGGSLGTNTGWPPDGSFDLTVRGGGVVTPPAGQAFNSVSIASNSWLVLSNQFLTIASNATVQAGGGIVADGTGYASNQGPGAGRYYNAPAYGYVGGGGGYGGYGAAAAVSSFAGGGNTSGSLINPIDRGSGGGSFALNYGGAGGGAIRLNVTGALIIDGRLSAEGGAGGVPGAGGGSGGSIWLTVGTLSGSGLISANGGVGNGLGGGGGGGRIALQYAANAFTGPITAFGGGGSSFGGAGTIYLKPNNQLTGQVLVDNGGRYGTNTTISSLSSAFDLTARNGAALSLSGPSLLLSNLDIGPGGSLSLPGNLRMDLTVLRDALIDTGGVLTVDGKGYSGMNGPGHGATLNSVGSGGGYGGKGGASSLQPGGLPYGSALQPIDFGSSGGFGYGTWTGGSEGGGALHLSVGRALTVNGLLSADGNAGQQDDSGGGSGGSIWVSAAVFDGAGVVSADGAPGELYQGGGGGGGRVAIYTSANLFGGVVSASGADGFTRGDNGTIYYGSNPAFAALTQSPFSTVSYAVGTLDLTFNTAIDPYTVLASDVSLTTPSGVLPASAVTVAATGSTTVSISFPPQTAEGAYSVTFGSQLQSLYGQPLSQIYTGAFAIAWPVIQGMIVDSQNQPVAGVVLQPDGGLPATHTDTTGSYSLKVMPSGNVTIVPALNNLVFVPRSQSYSNVTAPLELQNYLAVSSIAPATSMRYQSTGMVMSWQGIAGVTYQAFSSTNLVDWLPFGQSLVGTNGPAELTLPYDASPQMFFRLGASN